MDGKAAEGGKDGAEKGGEDAEDSNPMREWAKIRRGSGAVGGSGGGGSGGGQGSGPGGEVSPWVRL